MWTRFRITTGLKEEKADEKILDRNQWTRDFFLIDFGTRGLFSEYLEMSKKKKSFSRLLFNDIIFYYYFFPF